MAIPQLDVQCCDKYPKVRNNSRFLEVIVTGFHSTGGLPLKLARWFAMTGNRGTARQITICRGEELKGLCGEGKRGARVVGVRGGESSGCRSRRRSVRSVHRGRMVSFRLLQGRIPHRPIRHRCFFGRNPNRFGRERPHLRGRCCRREPGAPAAVTRKVLLAYPADDGWRRCR